MPQNKSHSSVSSNAAHPERSRFVRAVTVVAVTLALVGVLRWALYITNANTRQISTNLSRMRGQIDTQTETVAKADRDVKPREPARNDLKARPPVGPSIDPADDPSPKR